MLHNPHRLPLIINIGLLTAQANVHRRLDAKFPIIGDSSHEHPHYCLQEDLWASVHDLLTDLALMDHQNGFSPDASASPLLTEYGLLQEYWDIRNRYEPALEDYDWP